MLKLDKWSQHLYQLFIDKGLTEIRDSEVNIIKRLFDAYDIAASHDKKMSKTKRS